MGNAYRAKEQAFEHLQQHQQTRELCSRQLAQTQQQIELLEKDLSFLKRKCSRLWHKWSRRKICRSGTTGAARVRNRVFRAVSKTEALQKQWKEWQLELNHVQEKQQTLTEQRHDTEQKDEKIRAALEQNVWHGRPQNRIWRTIKNSLRRSMHKHVPA